MLLQEFHDRESGAWSGLQDTASNVSNTCFHATEHRRSHKAHTMAAYLQKVTLAPGLHLETVDSLLLGDILLHSTAVPLKYKCRQSIDIAGSLDLFQPITCSAAASVSSSANKTWLNCRLADIAFKSLRTACVPSFHEACDSCSSLAVQHRRGMADD